LSFCVGGCSAGGYAMYHTVQKKMAICDEFIYTCTDAILSRKWSFQEVHHLLASQLAVLPG